MNEILSAIAGFAKEVGEAGIETVKELPKWFNGNETLKEIANFEKADRPFNEIRREGGCYREVRETNEDGEVHHMPANGITDIPYNDGPSIHMEANDHRRTASWGYSKEAIDFREQQHKFMQDGNFKKAMQMDIDDIRSKFENKYDDGIKQATNYAKGKGFI